MTFRKAFSVGLRIQIFRRNLSRSSVTTTMNNEDSIKSLINEKGQFVKKESTFRNQITGESKIWFQWVLR